VSSDYFATLGTPLLAGRDFDARDDLGAPKVAIVNQTLAREVLGVENPVGKLLRREQSSSGDPETVFQIIGVVRDTKYGDLRESFQPIVYLPLTQDPSPFTGLDMVVRSGTPLADLVASLKHSVAEVSPSLLLEVDTLERMVRDSILRERLMAMLSGFFGLLAALLASIGLYGVVSYSVARRTHEIGIRMALGADRGKVTRMILGETLWLLAAGVAVGVVLALLAARTAGAFVLALLAARTAGAFLYGIPPHDPVTFGLALALMLAVSFLASVLPARRASRVDPMVALREE
jgi:putative ABC transport system permease protein